MIHNLKASEYPDAVCKGCVTYTGGEGQFCGVQLKCEGVLCPCAVCLTKSICDMDTCDEWFHYDNVVNQDRPRG